MIETEATQDMFKQQIDVGGSSVDHVDIIRFIRCLMYRLFDDVLSR